jgi:hypothetical protein
MSPHREDQTYRGHTLTVDMDAPGGRVLRVWIAGYTSSFATVKKAKERIDEALVAMPPLPESGEEPPPPRRPRMRP